MKMKHLLAGAVLAPLLAASPAQAEHRDYCRSFTKSIRVGGNIEAGYGRACLQPDGSWRVVASGGTVNPFHGYGRDRHHDRDGRDRDYAYEDRGRRDYRHRDLHYSPYPLYYSQYRHGWPRYYFRKQHYRHAKHHYKHAHEHHNHGFHCGHRY